MKSLFNILKTKIKQVYVFCLFILALSATIVSIIFNQQQEIKLQKLLANNQNPLASNLLASPELRGESLLPDPVPDYEETRDVTIAPETLYMLNTFPEFPENKDSLSSTDLNKIKNYNLAFSKFGIPNKDFQQAYFDIETWLNMKNNDAYDDDFKRPYDTKASTAFGLYTKLNDVKTNFNKINHLEATTEELKIYKPNNIFKIKGAAQNNPLPSDYIVSDPNIINNFEYKVAEISINELKNAKTTSLVFSIANQAIPGYANSNYQIIINNQENDLYDIASNAANTGKVISKLVDNSNIIIREMGKAYDADAPVLETIDFFTIEFDGENINILIKPQNYVSSGKPITFAANNENAKKIANVGFLDTTISPIYQSENYANPGDVKVFKGTDTLSSFNVHYNIAVNKGVVGNSQSISFWIKEKATIDFDLFFRKQSTVFSQDNTLTLKYENDEIIPSKFKFELKQGIGAVDSGKLSWNYQNYTFGGIKYAYVTLSADGTVISFNYDDNAKTYANISLNPTGDQKVFWEVPGNFTKDDGSPGASGSEAISFSIASDTSNLYQDYLGYTYANMLGKIDPTDENRKQWYIDSQVDDELLGDQRIYDFDYWFYAENDQGGITDKKQKNSLLTTDFKFNEETSKKKLIDHDLTTGNYQVDGNNNILVLDANANNIAIFLNQFYNRYQKWLKEKFEQETALKGQDYFLPDSIGLINDWVKTHILDISGIGQKIEKKVNILATLATSSYSDLIAEDQQFIDSLSLEGNQYYLNLDKLLENEINAGITEATVKNLLDGTIANATDANANVNWEDPRVLQTNYIIMVLTEHFLVEAINEIINTENETFENVYANLLSDSMTQYLESNRNFVGVSSNALKVLDDSKLSNNFKDKGVLTIAGSPKTVVQSGANQLESLLKFIVDFNLEKLYLDSSLVEDFDNFYDTGILTDPKSYTDSSLRNNLDQMITMLDTIIETILGQDSTYSLKEIIDKLETGTMVNDQAVSYIGQTFNNMIEKIVSGKEDAFIYEVLNTYAHSSYLENIVIGHNLSILYETWIALHPDLDDQTKSELGNLGFYDPATIAKISVVLEYYNVAYFLDALVSENKIPGTLDELLQANLAQSITFEIPETNWFIKTTTDMSVVAQYSLIGLGLLMSSLGSMIVFMAFKKGLVKYLSNKAIMSARAASIVVVVLGITLIIIGTIIGPL